MARPMYEPIPDKVLHKVGLPPLDLSDKPTKDKIVLVLELNRRTGKAP